MSIWALAGAEKGYLVMLKAKNIPVLMYHHVSNSPGLVTISPKTFREQMKWIAENGWKTLTSDDLEFFYRGGRLPRKSIMLTFDDGYLDNWLYVYPVLKEFGLKAHIFIITNLIGEGDVRYNHLGYAHNECEQLIREGQSDLVMLRWSEIHEMLRDEIVEFHVHTHTHTRWDYKFTCTKKQCEQLHEDILSSKNLLIKKTGKCSKHLCWPEGYYNYDYIITAQKLGFSYLYTTERRMNTPKNGTWQIGRISTKEREHSAWLKRRLFYYTTPVFS